MIDLQQLEWFVFSPFLGFNTAFRAKFGDLQRGNPVSANLTFDNPAKSEACLTGHVWYTCWHKARKETVKICCSMKGKASFGHDWCHLASSHNRSLASLNGNMWVGVMQLSLRRIYRPCLLCCFGGVLLMFDLFARVLNPVGLHQILVSC